MTGMKFKEGDGPLHAATELGEMVRGTNSSSRYVTVLLGKHVNVAVRAMHQKLSVRVERKDAGAVFLNGLMQDMGFATSSDSTHASMHVSGLDNDGKMVRAIGSVIAGLVHALNETDDKVVSVKQYQYLQGEGA